MKLFVLLALAVTLTGCGNDRTKVINNTSRIVELEKRMKLNEQLDAAQSLLIQANADAIASEQAAREAADSSLDAALQQEIADRAAADSALQALLDAEAAARQAGDSQLAADLQIEIANRIAGDAANSSALSAAMFMQALINFGVQSNFSLINFKISQINSKINNLMHRVDNLEEDVDALQDQANQLASDISSLHASLSAEIDALSAQNAATQAQLNAEGVKVFKCNSASSTERILKINGKFYAAMNRVSKSTIQVVTGSSSQSYSTPDMCQTYSGELEMPNSAGNCTLMSDPFKSTKIPGQTIVVPAYTTASVSVVSDVKIAIDRLMDGSYATTDGGPACSFSISGGGSSASNLIQVQ